ncbi:Protein CBG26568 [Caenorhabditis briggsae]|uniref:Protein CBG26568 n=1 Tax=Caenorhabditis briggsae TaxID=6238 RepID=B6IH02_CAEBR|nr:Protein CBG26568 [Caenorhabditis briggsae]CAR99182.1 Protein CBG26568 [Caenorhabditis briggsae]
MYPILPLPSLLGSLTIEEIHHGADHGRLEGSLLGDAPEQQGGGQPYAGLLALRDQRCPLVPKAENPSEDKIDGENVQKAPEVDSAEKLEIEDDPEAKKEDDGYDLLDEIKTEEIIEEESFVVLFNKTITFPK